MMNEPKLIHTKEQLEQSIQEEETLILYFSSNNCNVCHAFLPKLMELVADDPISVFKISVDEFVDIAGQYLVFTVPTLLVMHQGKEVLRESRFIDLAAVDRALGFFREDQSEIDSNG